MKSMVALVAAMTAVVAAGVGAASALALPDLAVSLGGSYPLRMITILKERTMQISNPVELLKGEGLTLEYTFNGLGSTGRFEFTLKKFENAVGKKSCKTEGDAAGEVLMKGTVDLVLVKLPAEGELALGALYLLEALTIECGELKIKVKGSFIGDGNEAGSLENVQYIGLNIPLLGNGAGKPAWTKYYNAAGEEKHAKLETNFGTGFKESAFEAGEVAATAEGGAMYVFTGT